MNTDTEISVENISPSLFKTYLTREQDRILERRLDDLIKLTELLHAPRPEIERVGRLSEGKILVLVGRSGAGKTRALDRAFGKRSEFASLHNIDGDCPLISVRAPSPCTLKQLGIELLKALGYPLRRSPKEYEVWDMVRERLKMQGVRYVHIDEIQHVTAKANRNQVQNVRDTFKGLVQRREWPISMILSGTPQSLPFLEDDTQVKRRCMIVSFPDLRIDFDQDWVRSRILRLVEDKTPLTDVREEGELIARLMHAAEYQFGTLIEFVHDAALDAVERRETALSSKHFATAYTARTGCAVGANVFSAPNWRNIIVANALQDFFTASEETAIEATFSPPRVAERPQ